MIDLDQLTNPWLRKTLETRLVQIVTWAQKNNKLVEELTEEDVNEALGGKEEVNFVRHSEHRDNAFTKDVTLERGREGYKNGVRINLSKWTGYIVNAKGDVVTKDDSIELYASDSNQSVKSRPDQALIFTEADFQATESKPLEFEINSTINGHGYFNYQRPKLNS